MKKRTVVLIAVAMMLVGILAMVIVNNVETEPDYQEIVNTYVELNIPWARDVSICGVGENDIWIQFTDTDGNILYRDIQYHYVDEF